MHATLSALRTKLTTTDSTAGTFRGLASTFGGEPDDFGDVVLRGAFAASLAAHKAKGTRPAMLWHHRLEDPIGVWTSLRETAEGLEVEGRLNLDVARGREAHALMLDDALALSIGYRVMPNGSMVERGIQYLQQVDLLEVSAVSIPANSNARITEVKGILGSPGEFEHAVRDALGLSARQAKRLCAGGWSAMVRDEPAERTDSDLVAIASQIRAITKSLRN
ncbi:HK97 family phage prohead protease [Dokdonella immobilis]|uniref:Prohead serine protease domain-containing protein n=1 Tax=Dokdonella immobilis TaxID=578942 RepID=A0A1I4VVN6_9GAMM|nr:HK97 family phage prohead protease [Dokdonella immobilis]SFN05069.1 prohead peptidase. Unknown type peptidase. MEROPS family U35 [Dokdonella immobilis]